MMMTWEKMKIFQPENYREAHLLRPCMHKKLFFSRCKLTRNGNPWVFYAGKTTRNSGRIKLKLKILATAYAVLVFSNSLSASRVFLM